jgi:L-iditol 2-dehydrogenase
LQRAERIGLPNEKRITHRFPLSQLQQAFETTLRQEGVKIMVENI